MLVVGANLSSAVPGAGVDDLLFLLDLFFQLTLLAGQDFELDLDDALDELGQLLGETLEATAGQIARLVHRQRALQGQVGENVLRDVGRLPGGVGLVVPLELVVELLT